MWLIFVWLISVVLVSFPGCFRFLRGWYNIGLWKRAGFWWVLGSFGLLLDCGLLRVLRLALVLTCGWGWVFWLFICALWAGFVVGFLCCFSVGFGWLWWTGFVSCTVVWLWVNFLCFSASCGVDII